MTSVYLYKDMSRAQTVIYICVDLVKNQFQKHRDGLHTCNITIYPLHLSFSQVILNINLFI